MLTSWQNISFSKRPWSRRTDFSSPNAPDLHSGGNPFESGQEILTEVFCVFPHSLQADARIVRQICHDGFLTHPLQFIAHQSSNNRRYR